MPDESTTSDRDEDVQAHLIKSGRSPAQPAETEAHGFSSGRRQQAPPVKGERPDEDESPDVQGHGISSNR